MRIQPTELYHNLALVSHITKSGYYLPLNTYGRILCSYIILCFILYASNFWNHVSNNLLSSVFRSNQRVREFHLKLMRNGVGTFHPTYHLFKLNVVAN